LDDGIGDTLVSGRWARKCARLILWKLCFQLESGDALLLGTDMAKDEATLLAAYDDSDGITAAFNLNILHRLNRELGRILRPLIFIIV
jgi:uncharacterized SAM-dependent methyltransferase